MTATFDAPPDEQDLGRVPPQDIDAEQSVLGSMMMSKDAIGEVVSTVAGRDFYRPAHETVFNAILALYGRGEPADPITVAGELHKSGDLGRCGGPAYIHDLVSSTPTAASAQYYAEIVHEKAVLRRLVEAGTRITQMGYAAQGDAAEISDRAQAELYAAVETSTDQDPTHIETQSTFDVLEQRGRGGQMSGVPTGFSDLDSLTNGWQPGQMIVIAARPAIGKSTLAVDALRACAVRHGRPAVIFSLEMGRSEIQERILSAEGKVAHHHMKTGALTDDDWTKLARVQPRVDEAPLFIDDSPNQTMMQIRSKSRKLKAKHGLDLIVVDYLQLAQSGSSRRVENRQQEVSDMSRSLKLLAKELEVPVLALSQLNRGPEQRQDKRPQVSDLRESGSIENDADMVILLHREDAYDKTSARAGEADLIVGKHRNGPTATITLAFQGHYSRFVDMAAGY